MRALHECMILFGHVGYSEEYLLERRLRDAMWYEIGAAPEQIQKFIISRELMGREIMS